MKSMNDQHNQAFATRAVHAGERAPAPDYTPVVTPIHPTVGFLYESMEDLDGIFGTTRPGYVYPRYGSPTVTALEEAVADLEGGPAAFAFATGMAAINVSLLAAGVRAGTGVVGALDLYGATYMVLKRLFSDLGATSRLVDVADLAAVEAALVVRRQDHILALIVGPSEPAVKVADCRSWQSLPTATGRSSDDATFAPYLANP
jgi:O-acetylhomoserine/O-acetylserine sulfhydrylase-like pyridoxal-dependent enzyme